MKRLAWVIAGVSVAFAAYIVLNHPGPEYMSEKDDVDDAADRTTLWGSKQRLSGAGGRLVGSVKEGLGRVTGNDQLAGEGVADQLAGAVKDTAGKVAQAAGDTIHQLNR
jgi:uncharacterized protein YjbJ (UPF0337 family)